MRETSGKFSESEKAAERIKKLKILQASSSIRSVRKSFSLTDVVENTDKSKDKLSNDLDLILTHQGKDISEIQDDEITGADLGK